MLPVPGTDPVAVTPADQHAKFDHAGLDPADHAGLDPADHAGLDPADHAGLDPADHAGLVPARLAQYLPVSGGGPACPPPRPRNRHPPRRAR